MRIAPSCVPETSGDWLRSTPFAAQTAPLTTRQAGPSIDSAFNQVMAFHDFAPELHRVVIVKHPQNRHPRSDRRPCNRDWLPAPGFAHPAPAHVAHAVPGKHENNPYSGYICYVLLPKRLMRLYFPLRYTVRPVGRDARTSHAQRPVDQIKQCQNQQRSTAKSHYQTPSEQRDGIYPFPQQRTGQGGTDQITTSRTYRI